MAGLHASKSMSTSNKVLLPRFLGCRCLAAILIFQGLSLRAQKVETKQGNVYYTDATGKTRQITSGGMDVDPNLSIDGKMIIFVRRTLTPARSEEPTDLHPNQSQIWIANIDGAKQPQMFFAGPLVVKGGSEYVTFAAPKLAPDNSQAFFGFPLAVDEGGLARLDLKAKDATMISSALNFYVIGSGNYKGDVVVQMLKLVGDGFSRFFWLITPDGKELGFVGESEEDAQKFLRNPNRVLGKDPLAR
jgi:hypothetical protein